MKKTTIIVGIVSIIAAITGGILLGYTPKSGYTKTNYVFDWLQGCGYWILFLFLASILTILTEIILNQRKVSKE